MPGSSTFASTQSIQLASSSEEASSYDIFSSTSVETATATSALSFPGQQNDLQSPIMTDVSPSSVEYSATPTPVISPTSIAASKSTDYFVTLLPSLSESLAEQATSQLSKFPFMGTANVTVCPEGSVEVLNACYIFLLQETNSTWTGGRASCRELGGDLAIIYDCYLMQIIIGVILSNGSLEILCTIWFTVLDIQTLIYIYNIEDNE